LSDVTRFSARSSACVEDLFSGLGTQNLTGNCGAWILNVAVALPDSVCRKHIKFNELGITRHRSRVRIKSEELFAVDFQLINPSVDRRGKIVPFAEFFRVLDTDMLLPALDKKLWMRGSNKQRLCIDTCK